MTIRTRVLRSPAELEDLLRATLQLAISIYVEMMLAYLEEHKTKGGSQREEPAGTIPYATGALYTSMMQILSESYTDNLTAYFQYGVGVNYWQYIDQPRAAGSMPPEGPIRVWAAVMGIPQVAVPLIRWWIYHHGWGGRQFWRPFARECTRSWVESIEAAFNQVGIPFTWQGRDVVIL